MSSKLIAGNATNGSSLSADTTGILEIQTGSTPTTAITVDTSQNVGIGTVPAAWNSSIKTLQLGPTASLTYFGVSGAQTVLYNNLYYNGAGNNIYQTTAGASYYAQSNGVHTWGVVPSGTAGNTASPLVGMTLNASSQLIMPSTTNGSYAQIQAGVTSGTSGLNGVIVCAATSVGPYPFYSNALNSSQGLMGFGYAGTTVGSISYNGTLVLYNQTSDKRLKENIVDAENALSSIEKIKIRSFDWINSKTHENYGVIAQELNEIAPQCVTEGTDNEDGTINKPWQVDTSPLVPMLIKAIQELNSKVDAQAAEIQALKGVA